LRPNENIGPEFTGRRGQVERRKLWRGKKVRDVIKEGDVAGFELKEQLETRICLDGNNSSSLRAQEL